jgi:DNA polymerase-3 subunit delta'
MTVWDRLYESGPASWLARIVSAGEVAHAWLFLGPPGSGKRLLAQVMAAALNCPVNPGTGCGECSTCLRTMRRRHPDVHHIVPEGPLIPVDVIREAVIPEAARSPFEGSRKVFVIEEADRMNDSAQNALLKTLEEPQPDTVFVLISDKEDDLLETIRSRCRIVRLEPVSEGRIVEMLKSEGIGEPEAVLAARLSDGDVERARSIALDSDGAHERRRLWVSLPARLMSPVDALDVAEETLGEARAAVKAREQAQRAEIIEFAEAIGEGRGTATARNALIKRHRRELRRVEEEVLGEALHTLASFYRDVLVAKSGGAEAIVNVDLAEDIAGWAASEVEPSALVRVIERCAEARADLAKNSNQLLTMESTLLEIYRLIPAPRRVDSMW